MAGNVVACSRGVERGQTVRGRVGEDEYAMIAIDHARLGTGVPRQPRVADRVDVARPHLLAHDKPRRHRDGPARRGADLRDGAFVVKDEARDVQPVAVDPVREARLWEATAELLRAAR